MSQYDLVFRARRAITPTGERPVTVAVRGGTIAAIEPFGTDLPAASTVTLRDDEVLLPGMVDTHVHVNEPGRTEWEGFATATRAAAAGGVTTIIDMPLNSLPPTVDVPRVGGQEGSRGREGLRGRRFLGRRDPRQHRLAQGSARGGRVRLQMLPARLRRAGVPAADAGRPARLPDRDPRVRRPDDRARRGRRVDRARPGRARLPVRRVPAVPATGRREHRDRACHRSRSVDRRPGPHPAPVQLGRAADDRVREARRGPPHRRDLSALPGFRRRRDRRPGRPSSSAARRSASRRIGTCCGRGSPTESSTASCPTTHPARRSSNDWTPATSASPGAASPACRWRCPRCGPRPVNRGFTLADVVRWMSATPAALAGLDRKGGLVVGRDADLVVFAPNQTFVVDAAELRHRNPITAYAGRTLTGVVRSTWLRGQELVGEQNRGQLIRSGATRHADRRSVHEDVDIHTPA